MLKIAKAIGRGITSLLGEPSEQLIEERMRLFRAGGIPI